MKCVKHALFTKIAPSDEPQKKSNAKATVEVDPEADAAAEMFPLPLLLPEIDILDEAEEGEVCKEGKVLTSLLFGNVLSNPAPPACASFVPVGKLPLWFSKSLRRRSSMLVKC